MIGERLRELRRKKGVNQTELASLIGVQKTSISLYESNKITPNDEMKVILARYFNVSLDYLLGVINEPLPYYSEDKFLKLPDGITRQERFLLSEHLGYLEYRRTKEC